MKISQLVQIFFESSPIFKIQPSTVSESVPPGPETPKSFCGINLTTSSVTLTGMNVGVLVYVSSVYAGDIFSCGCFSARTVATVLLVGPNISEVGSLGDKTRPVSHLHTKHTASPNFPRKIMLENIQ